MIKETLIECDRCEEIVSYCTYVNKTQEFICKSCELKFFKKLREHTELHHLFFNFNTIAKHSKKTSQKMNIYTSEIVDLIRFRARLLSLKDGRVNSILKEFGIFDMDLD